MSSDVEEFVRYQIANAQVRPYPYPHFWVNPVFPEAFYRELQSKLPRTEILTPMHAYGTVSVPEQTDARDVGSSYEPRYIADLATLEEHEEAGGAGQVFWRDLSTWLLEDAFRSMIMEKFRGGIAERFAEGARLVTEVEARFVRDFHQYRIHPHTDMPSKLVSLLFYLPADDSLRAHGTAIYRPIDPNFRCEGKARHAFGLFRKVATMPFVPNSLLGFLKTDRSFHGVEEITDERAERNVLLYNIYARKVLGPPRPKAARSIWPWKRDAQRA